MRAVVVDHHELIRNSLVRLLMDALSAEEVIEAGDLESGLKVLAEHAPADLVICDLAAPGSCGPESMRSVVEAAPTSHVVVISGSETRSDVIGCLAVGVSGFVPKSHSVSEVVAALRHVLQGGVYVPLKSTRSRTDCDARVRRTIPAIKNLTPRQREVLEQLLLGRATKEIARTLGVAEGTVKIHLAAIYRTLGVKSRAEAIAKLMSS